MVLIPNGSLRGHFAGHSTPHSIYSDMGEHVTDVPEEWALFTASTKHLVRQSMGFEQVWCPLHLRRKEVEVTPWCSLAMRDVLISATFGFHQAMYGVLQVANNCSTGVTDLMRHHHILQLFKNVLQLLDATIATPPCVWHRLSSFRYLASI